MEIKLVFKLLFLLNHVFDSKTASGQFLLIPDQPSMTRPMTSNGPSLASPSIPNQSQSQNLNIPSYFGTLITIGLPCLIVFSVFLFVIFINYFLRLKRQKRINRNISDMNQINLNDLSFASREMSIFSVNTNEAYTIENRKKENPPMYDDILKSKKIDKLPTYASFREKRTQTN